MIISKIRMNRQFKSLSNLLSLRETGSLSSKVSVILGLSLALSSKGFCFPKQIGGMDLVRGHSVQVDFKQARLATVVLFLSSRCPCSASHQITLEKLSKEFTPQGFRFVGVHSNADEEEGIAKEYFKNSGLTFPVIQDRKCGIADALGAFKTPHVFVLGSDGEVLFQGGVDNSHISNQANKHYLKDALALIAEGKKPSQKEVRVLGCEIRR
jgi:peroxiredoxin